MGWRGAIVLLGVLVVGCSSSPSEESTPAAQFGYPAAPAVGDGPRPDASAAFTSIVAELPLGGVRASLIDDLAAAGDARHAWLVADLLRFLQGGPEGELLVEAFVQLTGVDPRADPRFASAPWTSVTNHLLAWDLAAPDDYRELKASLFTVVEPRWAPFFADADAEVDWRWVSWGGVRIDDRPLGDVGSCPGGCIPALDDPALTAADEGGWYPDDGVVFGVVVDDDAVAFPKHIMEVHEMVNLTIGGRRLAVPYCTLCGAAQAYATDDVPPGIDVPVVRTSGLLSRSNKVMFDLHTFSLFDTFTGAAVSGPLRESGVALTPVSVVTTTWAEWAAAHPTTSIVAEDGGLGRTYSLDPLRGRDDDGPIFPIGDVDGRRPVHELVVGVITADGSAVAFPAATARRALADGRDVTLGDVELVDDAGGLRARTSTGTELVAHEAFWFAWSQFHPGTQLWEL